MSEFIEEITKELDSRILKDTPGGKPYLIKFVQASLQEKYTLIKEGDTLKIHDKNNPSLEAYDNHVKVNFKSAVDKLISPFVDDTQEFAKREKAQKDAQKKREEEEANKHVNKNSLQYHLASEAAKKNKKLLESMS